MFYSLLTVTFWNLWKEDLVFKTEGCMVKGAQPSIGLTLLSVNVMALEAITRREQS